MMRQLFGLMAVILIFFCIGADTPQAAKQRQAVRAKLVAAAKGQAFVDAVKKVTELSGVQPKKLETEAEGDDTGGVVFTVTHAKAEELLKQPRADLMAKGVYLFRHGRGHGLKIGGQELPDEIALLPTKDKYDVLAAVETEGPNSGHYSTDVLAFVKELEKTHPFDLTEAGADFLAGTFKQPVADAAALAKKLNEFDNDIEEEEHLKEIQKGQFLLWWD
jgi:hypothetical protein